MTSVIGTSDVPVPDDGTDFDIDDEPCWALWLKEIRMDGHFATDKFQELLRQIQQQLH